MNKIDEQLITITLEEYKELLIIKGRYEEIKSQTAQSWSPSKTTITYRNPEWKPDERKVTC